MMSSVARSGMATELVTDLSGLLSLEGEWDDLVARLTNVEYFSSFSFVAASCRYLHPDAALHVVVLRAGGRLVGIAPLVRRRRGPLEVVQFIGHGSADYGDVLVESAQRDAFVDVLGCELSKRNLLLRNVRADSPNRPLFEALTGGNGILCARNPFVALTGSAVAYLGSLRKRTVQDGRRQLRRLERLGSVEFGSVTAEADLGQALDALVEFKSERRYRHDVAVNPYAQKDRRAFLEEVCRAALRHGQLRFELLLLDKMPIAAHVGIVFRDKYYYFLPGFSGDHAQFSPGRLLLQQAIEWSFQAGLQEFDFLNGEERYKYQWSTNDRETVTYHRFRPAVLSWCYGLWYGRLKTALRRHRLLFLFVRRLRTGRLR